MTPRVAIIGGGLAGLTAARRLLARNVEVVVIDKGRRVGGRMCTRAVELPDGSVAQFDLGPQLLYTRNPFNGDLTPEYRVVGLATAEIGAELFQHLPLGRITATEVAEDEFAGVGGVAGIGGMRELPFRLVSTMGSELVFHDHTLAETLQRTDDGWRIHVRSLRDQLASVVSANGLILTAPVPQTLELLERNRVVLPDELRDDLRKVTYSRCLAVYGVFTGRDPLQPGGVWFGDGPIEWITDNHLKGVSPVPWSVTALTTDEWATEHWDEPDARVLELLLPRLRPWVGDPLELSPVALHRWRWAQPLTPIRTACAPLRNALVVLAGDGFAGTVPDPADAALISGEAAANRMCEMLTRLGRDNNRFQIARPKRYLLEIAVSTPWEAYLAATCGADRLELSSGLEVGGLTPSMGLFRRALDTAGGTPVYVMIRPRAGGFVYSDSEQAVMRDDAQAFIDAGAAGIVFGALTERGDIDHALCQSLVHIASRRAVFHRAFDFLPNPRESLDDLIGLGFERVLTSGGASTAETGRPGLEALVQHAGWQIEVLPAGDIRPHNVRDLVRTTRCEQVHSSARAAYPDPLFVTHPRVAGGLGGGTELSADIVRRLRDRLDRLAEELE